MILECDYAANDDSILNDFLEKQNLIIFFENDYKHTKKRQNKKK